MRPIQFFLLGFVLVALAKLIFRRKQQRMPTLEFTFWVLAWLGAFLIITFPDATSFLARLLGIGRGADLIMYSSLLVAFYLILRIHLILDRFEQEVTEIVRALALERMPTSGDPSLGEDK